jgi:hypothetical protein
MSVSSPAELRTAYGSTTLLLCVGIITMLAASMMQCASRPSGRLSAVMGLG